MGWGCTKHELDEGSRLWVQTEFDMAEIMNPPNSRAESPCPICVAELYEKVLYQEDLEQIIKDNISEVKKYTKRHESNLSEHEKGRYDAVVHALENVIMTKKRREIEAKQVRELE